MEKLAQYGKPAKKPQGAAPVAKARKNNEKNSDKNDKASDDKSDEAEEAIADAA
jgi:hypothetical protein